MTYFLPFIQLSNLFLCLTTLPLTINNKMVWHSKRSNKIWKFFLLIDQVNSIVWTYFVCNKTYNTLLIKSINLCISLVFLDLEMNQCVYFCFSSLLYIYGYSIRIRWLWYVSQLPLYVARRYEITLCICVCLIITLLVLFYEEWGHSPRSSKEEPNTSIANQRTSYLTFC